MLRRFGVSVTHYTTEAAVQSENSINHGSLYARCWTDHRNGAGASGRKSYYQYSVHVGGLAVYAETYDVGKIAAEIAANREEVKELWMRRLEAVVHARDKPRFSASLTAALADG